MKDKPLKYIILGSIAGIAIIYLIITLLNQLFERQVISQIKDKGELVVLIRNAPTIYYEGPQKPKGFEYELMAAFAEHLGVDLRLKVYAGIGELLAAIENKEGDLATGAITRTEEREDTYVFGPDYYTVQQVAVYRGGMKRPENIEDLANFEIQIIAESSYDERLRQLKEEYPDLEWETTDELSTEQLLYQVWRGELECTIADQNIVAINRRYYPGIEVAFPIGEEQSLAWVLNEDLSELGSVLEDWLDDFDEAGSLARLRDKYYGYVEIYDFVDLREFHKRIRWRLPVYRKWFQEAAEKYNIPWTLLAAQAYQESHWNKRAKSPTGVRGVMMLTRNTAQSVGVSNRLNPYQSIMGGAKYLARMMKRVPDSVRTGDRLAFALAAYNVGMGHMQDAQQLAQQLDYNPNSWNDLMEVLPLLTQKKYYRKLKHGYARGTEPVRYVERIFNYRNILENTLNLKK